MLKELRFIAILCVLALQVTGVRANREGLPANPPQDSLPSYIRVLPYDASLKAVVLPDSVFNRIAGSTIFRVNRTELNTKDPFLRELIEVVFPNAREEGLELIGIEMRGAASPEGPYWNNVRLAKGRAEALRQFIASHNDPNELFSSVEVQTFAEDYAYLLWYLEQHNDPAAPIVRQVIEQCGIANPFAIKKRLQAYNNGVLWFRLLADVYPRLRAARIVLYFRSLSRPIEFVPYTDTLRAVADLDVSAAKPLLPEIQLTPEVQPTPEKVQREYRERRHMLAVNTNLLFDAFYMPRFGMAPMWNVGVEFFPRKGHFTYLAQFTSPYYHRWSKQQFFQIRDYHLEARYYFRPQFYHTGWFVAAYANLNKYGIGLSKTEGWEGEGVGGALKAGYVWHLGKSGRWRLELSAAVGGYLTRHDPYVYGNPITGTEDGDYYYDYTGPASSFLRRNHQRTWFGPTELCLTLSYDLLFWKNNSKGISFKRKEVVQ